MTYGAKCYELARQLLQDFKHREGDVEELAKDFQRAYEDYVDDLEPK